MNALDALRHFDGWGQGVVHHRETYGCRNKANNHALPFSLWKQNWPLRLTLQQQAVQRTTSRRPSQTESQPLSESETPSPVRSESNVPRWTQG